MSVIVLADRKKMKLFPLGPWEWSRAFRELQAISNKEWGGAVQQGRTGAVFPCWRIALLSKSNLCEGCSGNGEGKEITE